MSDAPKRIWCGPDADGTWDYVWAELEPEPDLGRTVPYVREDAAEVEALRRENERLRSLVFVGYQEGYAEAGGHWRSDSGWNDSETKFALDNPPPSAALQGETD